MLNSASLNFKIRDCLDRTCEPDRIQEPVWMLDQILEPVCELGQILEPVCVLDQTQDRFCVLDHSQDRASSTL